MRKLYRIVNWIILIALLTLLVGPAIVSAQDDPDKFIAALIEQMSPQAKVGQLFIVAFAGADASANSDIARLIREYYVGGVALSPEAGNILNSGNTPWQVATLTAALQNQARAAAQTVNPATGKTTPFIPLLVALPFETGAATFHQGIHGMTPMPSPLMLGATWSSQDAQAAGKLFGQELAALGVNVILGPSFDIASTTWDNQMFGGDPYWVNVIGQAFVQGVREGSANRIVTALSHFPGQGEAPGSDGAIGKSLDELKQLDLLPFLQAIELPGGEGRPLTDALLVTQMRYRGFTGNYLERTRPLSVDAQAMQSLLTLPQVKAWRDSGQGVLFSGSLGSPALRQYYASLAAPPQRIAQDAFQAGNDILILTDFGGDSWPEQLNAITTTLTFFQNKYSTDLAFQTRVNDALPRILRLKYRLYPRFDPATVIVNPTAVTTLVGLGQEIATQVAQDAATRLWPPAAQPLPLDPQSALVIITDNRQVRDCPTCAPRPVIGADALANVIVQRYGASGRIDPTRVSSLRFSDVQDYLAGIQREGAPDVGATLGGADVVILALLDRQLASAAQLVRRLLVTSPEILGDKQVVAFSFGDPQALERDEINRVAAYYCLYSSSASSIQVAAQILFGDLPAPGALPVSLPAIGYDLTRQIEPDPNQMIQILVGETSAGNQTTPRPVEVKVGDKLAVRAGPILDRNGHPVPDGTQVTFTRLFSDNIELPPITISTVNGIAKAEIVLDKVGLLRIRAFSEPALTSYELQVTSLENQQVTITAIAPPTRTPLPVLPTSTPTPRPTATPTPTPTPVPPWWAPLTHPAAPRRVGWSDLFLALGGIAAVGLFVYRLTLVVERANHQPNGQIVAARWALWCVMAGLTGYALYGLGLPGVNQLDSIGSAWAALIASVVSALMPLVVAWGWREATRRVV